MPSALCGRSSLSFAWKRENAICCAPIVAHGGDAVSAFKVLRKRSCVHFCSGLPDRSACRRPCETSPCSLSSTRRSALAHRRAEARSDDACGAACAAAQDRLASGSHRTCCVRATRHRSCGLIPNWRHASTIVRSPRRIATSNFIRSFPGLVWLQGSHGLDPRRPDWSASSVTHVPGSDLPPSARPIAPDARHAPDFTGHDLPLRHERQAAPSNLGRSLA
jgi:hypothetical protein